MRPVSPADLLWLSLQPEMHLAARVSEWCVSTVQFGSDVETILEGRRRRSDSAGFRLRLPVSLAETAPKQPGSVAARGNSTFAEWG